MSSFKVVAVPIRGRSVISRFCKCLTGTRIRSSYDMTNRTSRRRIFRSRRRTTVQAVSMAYFLDHYSVPQDLNLDTVTFKLNRELPAITFKQFDWTEHHHHLKSLALMLTINHSLKDKLKRQDHQYERYELSLDEVITLSNMFKRSFNPTKYLKMMDYIIENGLFSIFVHNGFTSSSISHTHPNSRFSLCCSREQRSDTFANQKDSVVTVREKFNYSILLEKIDKYISSAKAADSFIQEFVSLRDQFIRKLSVSNDLDKDPELEFVLKTTVDQDLRLVSTQYSLLLDCLLINRLVKDSRYRLTLNEADLYSKLFPLHFSIQNYLELTNSIDSQFHLFAIYRKGFNTTHAQQELLVYNADDSNSVGSTSSFNAVSQALESAASPALESAASPAPSHLVVSGLNDSFSEEAGVEIHPIIHNTTADELNMRTPYKSSNPFEWPSPAVDEFSESLSSPMARNLDALWATVLHNTTDLGSPKSKTTSRSGGSLSSFSRRALTFDDVNRDEGLGVELLPEGADRSCSAGMEPEVTASTAANVKLERKKAAVKRIPARSLAGKLTVADAEAEQQSLAREESERQEKAARIELVRAKFLAIFGNLNKESLSDKVTYF